jgi:chorismate synthase
MQKRIEEVAPQGDSLGASSSRGRGVPAGLGETVVRQARGRSRKAM